MSDLAECLQILHHNLKLQDESAVFKCEHQIKSIEQLCSRSLFKKELGLYCSLLLQGSEGILPVLTKSNFFTQHKSLRDQCLTFLSNFISRFENYVHPYTKEIRKACLDVFRRDKYSKNREKALQVVIQIAGMENEEDDFHWVDQSVKFLFEELGKAPSKTTSTVRGRCLHALGALARYHSDMMAQYSNRLYDIYLRGLKKEMITSTGNGDMKIIEGSLDGLRALMFTFTALLDQSPERCREIYKFSRMAIAPQEELSRFGVPLAAMKLMSDHSEQFGDLLLEDYKGHYNALEAWFYHKNPNTKHAAHIAIQAFLRQVVKNISGNSSVQKSRDLFLFFIKKFESMIKSDDTNSKAMSLAVQGYGMLAAPCRRYLSHKDVSYMFSQMLVRCEQMYLSSDDHSDNKIHQLPTFVSSLSNIASQLLVDGSSDADQGSSSGVPEVFVRSLERLCVLLIENYPRLHRKFSVYCHKALVSCVEAFSGRPEMMKKFVDCIVFQGLIRSCSLDVVLGDAREERDDTDHQMMASNSDDINLDVMRDSRTVSYKNYIPLWVALISGKAKVPSASSNPSLLSHSFLASFIRAITEVTGRLNLEASSSQNTNENELERPGSAPIHVDTLQANNPADFKIFVNLCDLCADVFPLIAMSTPMEMHIHRLVLNFVALSTRFPLASGFYKLLSSTMRTSVIIGYFSSKSDPYHMDVDGNAPPSQSNENTQCCIFLQRFAVEVAGRSKQYKDELQAACLFFILNLPLEVAHDILPELLPPLQRACLIGLGYFPLAEAVLGAIERWKLSTSGNEKVLSEVVPCLEPFLHSNKEVVVQRTMTPQRTIVKKRSILKRGILPKESDDPSRKKVRSQVIKFFGDLGGNVFDWLKQSKESKDDWCVAPWSPDVCLKYPITFRDMKPDIRLDILLHRVMQICEQSSDRKAKISSCELLHSITIFIIGEEAQLGAKHEVTSLYKHLLPLLFRLACDPDQVCKQLFGPLVDQIIHWFTNNRKYESPNTTALLNTIMDGLIDDDNSSLRHLCATSLHEFMSWSIKQNTALSKAQHNSKSIFKRIYSLALHPAPMRRFGATLAFNSIYRIFREQEQLVDEFVLEILVTFVNCLALSHNDDASFGTVDSSVQALDHLERIIKAKASSLCKESNTRRVPKGISPDCPVTLATIVTWLFEQTGRPQTECRHQCMRLFIAFIKLLPNQNKSPSYWIHYQIKGGGEHGAISRFEGGCDGVGIATCSVMTSMGDKFNIKNAINWFELVLAALEAYMRAFQEKMLAPAVLCSDKSNLYKSVDYFIRNISQKSLDDIAVSPLGGDKSAFTCTPQERYRYNTAKCTLISRILQYFVLLFKLEGDNVTKRTLIPSGLEQSLLGLVSSVLVHPSALGFDTFNDPVVAEELSKLSSEILQLLFKYLPNTSLDDDMKGNLQSMVKQKILEHGRLLDLLPPPFGSRCFDSTLNVQDLLEAYRVLFNCGLLGSILSEAYARGNADLNEFSQSLFQVVYSSCVRADGGDCTAPSPLSPESLHFGGKLLDLVFVIGISPEYLIDSLMKSSTMASSEGLVPSSAHGCLFLSQHSEQIYKELSSKPATYIPTICQHASCNPHTCAFILSGVLEHIASNRSVRKNFSKSMCSAILDQWETSLKPWWHYDASNKPSDDVINNAIVVLKKVISLDATACRDPKSKYHSMLVGMYTSFLEESQLSLTFKSKLLDLLGFFSLSTHDDSALKQALGGMVARHFPLSSREFNPGSTSYNEYTQAIEKLLVCLQDTGNITVLEVVINIFCREEDHVMSERIQSAFENTVKSIPAANQHQALSLPYCLYVGASSHNATFRRHCVNDVLAPIMRHCDVTAVIEFYSRHIVEIMNVIKEDDIQSSGRQAMERLCMKTLAYRIMELMFTSLSEEHIARSSPVGHALAHATSPPSKDTLLKTFMKCANRDRTRRVPDNEDSREDWRRFHCSLYNAMMAAVVSTKPNVAWYKAFLFNDNPSKSEYFLDNVVDLKREYKFEMETQEPLKKRKRFVAIRKQRQSEEGAVENDVTYMSSIHVSSLSEDVSIFDANSSRTLSRHLAALDVSTSDVSSKTGDSSKIKNDNFVELDSDELNGHECMANMVALIEHMHDNAIGFPPEDADDTSPPSWMLTIIRKLSSSSSVLKNVRIFIARLIINCESHFRRFAAHLITPLLQCFLRGEFGSNGITSMVCDVLATTLSWNSVALPQDSAEGRHLVRAVVEKLCENVKSENLSVTRHNLDLVKTTLECWGGRVRDGIDPSVVYKLCGGTDVESKDNFAGLQVLGALLANGVAPYVSSYTVDRMNFFQRLSSNILYKRKDIYQSASEVMGMSLEYLSEVEKEDDGEVHQLVAKKLTTMYSSNIHDKFIVCLHKVALHHPAIVDQFATNVFFVLPKLHGDLRSKSFEIILQRADKLPDLHRQLKAKSLVTMLAIRDQSLQLTCVRLCHRLLYKAIDRTDDLHVNEVLQYFLRDTSKHFLNHSSPLCRQEALDVMTDAYDALMKLPDKERDEEMLSVAKLHLLKSLNDSEEPIRNQAVNFWNSKSRLPINPSAKLSSILHDLYHPTLEEEDFLSNAVGLILQSASLSPDFERPLFDHPLSDCVFREYAVDSGWRNKHAGMTPMFVDTLHSSASPTNDGLATPKLNVVLATQDNLQFSATLAGGPKNTYNWMTGSSLDTFASISSDEVALRKTSLLAMPVLPRTKRLFSELKPGPNFGKEMLSTGQTSASKTNRGVDVDVARLKRRYYKEKEGSSYKYAKIQEMKRKKSEQFYRDRKKEVEDAVQLHRGYRTGELPDIQITNRCLIVPLAAACQHDPLLSQLLMVLIISGINEKETKSNRKNSEVRLNLIHEELGSILRKSQEKCPALVGCILEIFFRDNLERKINPSDIATASLAANKQELGIAVLEQHIISRSEATSEPPSKRRKQSEKDNNNDDIDVWVELSRLYKSLANYDVLYGIFSNHSGSGGSTTEGLRLEGEANYKAACKVYQEALRADSEAREVEKDLWEEGLMHSLQNLSRWNQVDEMCISHLSSYEHSACALKLQDVWKYPDYVERYLESALHAKLLLLLQGNVGVGNELANFMDDAMKERGEKRSKVEKKFAEYLTMLYIYQEDYDRARYYLQLTGDGFSSTWTSVSALMRAKQGDLLRSITRISDIEDFLNLMKMGAGFSLSSITDLVAKWTEHDVYSVHDPITAWQDLVAYRCFFLDKLKRRFDSLNPSGTDGDALLSCVENGKMEMQLKLLDNSCSRRNFALARRILDNLEKDYDNFQHNETVCVKLSHQTARYYHAQARHLAVASNDPQRNSSFNFLLAAYGSLNEQNSVVEHISRDSALHVEHLLLLATTYDIASDAVAASSDDVTSFVDDMLPSRSADSSGSSDVTSDLQREAFTTFDKAARATAKLPTSAHTRLHLKSYMAMADFCDKQIRMKDETESSEEEEVTKFAVLLTQFVAKSMRLSGVIQPMVSLKIPRLLQLIERTRYIKTVFMRETQNLPSWMFLAWVGHMVALLDGDSGPALHPLINAIAEEYPQALVYPVMTAMKGYKYASSNSTRENKIFIKRLKQKLEENVPLANDFIEQLQFVSNPAVAFKDCSEEFCKLLEKKEKNTNEVMENYQNMYNNFFNCAESAGGDDSSLYGTPVSSAVRTGLLRFKFAKEYKKEFDQYFGGSTGTKLPGMNCRQVRKWIDNFKQKVNKFVTKATSLRDYSQWLANYQPLQHGRGHLEIPGQYHGRSRPLVEYHTTITGFDERVREMRSLRKPCRIIIRGSDESDHYFLVKGGEDLRQDQRIQSMFTSINNILAENVECKRKDLSLITYQVIPVSSKVGLIEWVKNVIPFWDFIEDHSRKMGCYGKLDELHRCVDWVPRKLASSCKSYSEQYGRMFKECLETDVVARFNEITSSLSKYIFRNAYLHLAASPQAFVTLRQRFVVSYGVMCVTHWLLGIGDRHTGNFLICTSSGKSVGIDFGHAFGSGTEILPVPELVPFRMTNQIVHLLAPHSEKSGEIRQVMVRCLSALRMQCDILLSILDVFIKDPSVDWTTIGKRSRNLESRYGIQDEETKSLSDLAWYAKRKMEIVKRKLEGEKPANITREELQHNPLVGSYRKSYCLVASGGPGSRRKGEPDSGLSVPVQVDCLIDQATDPNVLGRAWKGWKSWL